MNPIDFSSLEKKSKTINQRSNELNLALTAINKKLNSLNLGVEVFCSGALETTCETRMDDTQHGEFEREFDTSTYLGYGKHLDKWGLLLKTETLEKVLDDNNYRQWREHDSECNFLLSAPRQLRMKAVDHIERLVELLEEEADKLEASVGKAKKIAEKL